jgi:acetolactate synthase-1/2/3 large subunit
MSTTTAPPARSASASTTAASSTADDTLKEKSRDASVISGGHLVAKALKAEGVDTIFTLCGGHGTARHGGVNVHSS